MEIPHYGYSGTGNVSDNDLVDGFLIRAEALYGLNQPRVALIEENEILHACRGLPRYAAHFLVQPIYG